jgi:hypothetical protein
MRFPGLQGRRYVLRSGVRRFILVDDDVLFPANLTRNELSASAIGVHKVDALRARLIEVAGDVDITVRRVALGGQESADSTDSVMAARAFAMESSTRQPACIASTSVYEHWKRVASPRSCGGRSFHDREEVITLRNALTAIEWPDDELRVFATLHGPYFALGDEALLAFRQYADLNGSLKTRRLHPMHSVDRHALDPAAIEVADGLALLRQLHVGRNRRPIAETITMLLKAVRTHAGIALWPAAEQALANCQRLIDMRVFG